MSVDDFRIQQLKDLEEYEKAERRRIPTSEDKERSTRANEPAYMTQHDGGYQPKATSSIPPSEAKPPVGGSAVDRGGMRTDEEKLAAGISVLTGATPSGATLADLERRVEQLETAVHMHALAIEQMWDKGTSTPDHRPTPTTPQGTSPASTPPSV